MALQISGVSKLLILAGLLCLTHETSGFKGYNEVCESNRNYPQDPRNCDSSQYLVCSQMKVCACDWNLNWDAGLNKCTFSLGETCNGNYAQHQRWGDGNGDGGQHGGNVHPSCPRYAECSKTTGKCQCLAGHEANQRNECNGGSQITNILSTTVGITLFYFIAVKLL